MLAPFALTLMLAACSAGEKAAQTAVDAASPEQPPPPVTAPQTPPTMPAPGETPMPPADAPDGDRDLAGWDGYDALRFGMDEAALRKAWGGELKADTPMEGNTCTHLYPAWAEPAQLAFMFEDGRFVRYSVEDDTFLAPGDGRVGMASAQIDALYPGQVERQPHQYTDGEYLRIKAPGAGSGVLVFETDAKGEAGKVTQWRVGLPPQVDYVEGCS